MILHKEIEESKILLEGSNDDTTYIHDLPRDPKLFIKL